MKLVAITGATGLVGRHLIPLLLRDGFQVRALVRADSPGKSSLAAGIKVVDGDVWRYGGIPDQLTAGAEVAVSLAGMLYDRLGARVEDVNVRGVENFVTACQKAAVRRIIHLSVIGASVNGCSRYFRSKWQGEELVRNSGIGYTIFRPSIIYGPGSEFLKRLMEIANSPIAIPVLGHGQNLSQPVFAGDMADAIMSSIVRRDCVNQTIDACGPDAVTTDELVRVLYRAATGKKKGTIHVPPALVKPIAMIEEKISSDPKLTSDLLRMVTVDNTGDHTIFQRLAGHQLTHYADWCFHNFRA